MVVVIRGDGDAISIRSWKDCMCEICVSLQKRLMMLRFLIIIFLRLKAVSLNTSVPLRTQQITSASILKLRELLRIEHSTPLKNSSPQKPCRRI